MRTSYANGPRKACGSKSPSPHPQPGCIGYHRASVKAKGLHAKSCQQLCTVMYHFRCRQDTQLRDTGTPRLRCSNAGLARASSASAAHATPTIPVARHTGYVRLVPKFQRT